MSPYAVLSTRACAELLTYAYPVTLPPRLRWYSGHQRRQDPERGGPACQGQLAGSQLLILDKLLNVNNLALVRAWWGVAFHKSWFLSLHFICSFSLGCNWKSHRGSSLPVPGAGVCCHFNSAQRRDSSAESHVRLFLSNPIASASATSQTWKIPEPLQQSHRKQHLWSNVPFLSQHRGGIYLLEEKPQETDFVGRWHRGQCVASWDGAFGPEWQKAGCWGWK